MTDAKTPNPVSDTTAFETLETRQLMSGVTLDSGVLTINGLANNGNNATVRVANDKVFSVLNGKQQSFTLANVKSIQINGGDKADYLAVDESVKVPVKIFGGAGDDRLAGGSGNDFIEGGAGNDSVYGNAGNDTLQGHAGNDFIYGGTGNDSISGGTGANVLCGNTGNDTFVDTNAADKIFGGGGTDKITVAATTPVGNTPSGTVRIASLSLIDTDTGKVVPGYAAMTGTVSLDLGKLPAHLSVRANLSGGSSTVRFDLDGNNAFRVETSAPYALNGDAAGKLKPIVFSTGTHTLVASTVTGSTVTSSLGVTFKATQNAATPPSTGSTSPTPGDDDFDPGTDNGTDVATPLAVIKALSKTVPAGTAVHVDALSSLLKGGSWNDGSYDWDFGDPSGAANTMRGFNAAHVYDTAGSYTVTLTVTNAGGKSNTVSTTINVAAANRNVIYVSSSGSDDYDGSSVNRPVKTMAKALTLVDDNTEVLFKRGDTFAQTASFRLDHSNVLVGAYGSGAQPRIVWTGTRTNDVMFFMPAGVSNVTVQDLSIDTVFNKDTDDAGTPMAFKMGGTNFTARRNTLLNLQYGFMLNMNPTGVMIQDNTAPLDTGLRKYFAWVQGNHITIEGNYAANSTREHIVRANFVSMLNVSDNELHNISRRESGADYYDFRKPALNIQSGEFAYAYNNKIDSSFQVGPLGQTEGMKGQNSASMRFKYVVGDGNEVFNEQIVVNHGAEHVTMKNNVVHDDNSLAIAVDGYSSEYQRGVVDLNLQNNTVTNNGTRGNFIHVYGAVDGIRMTGNVYVAPNLSIGSYETAAVKLEPAAYDSFTLIDNNVWPVAADVGKWVGENAMNYVGTGYTTAGMLTAAEWNTLDKVGDDTFANVAPTSSYSLVLGGIRVGAKLAA